MDGNSRWARELRVLLQIQGPPVAVPAKLGETHLRVVQVARAGGLPLVQVSGGGAVCDAARAVHDPSLPDATRHAPEDGPVRRMRRRWREGGCG